MDPAPAPIYAGKPFTWSVFVGNATTYTPIGNATVEVAIANRSAKLLASSEAGNYVLPGSVASPGSWNFTVSVNGSEGVAAANGTLTVYRDLGARIVAADATQDVYTNRTTRMDFLTVDAHDEPVDAFGDLRIRLEHWSDDHRVLHWATERDLAAAGPGRWSLEYDFPQQGMYHMVFASTSGGFTFEETPLVHVYAVDQVDFGKKDKGTPAAPFALVVVLLGLAAAARRIR